MINNDRNVTTVSGSINETYRQNMISLNQYMATYAEQDTTVQPPQSAWHLQKYTPALVLHPSEWGC